jgi:cysteine desulfurase/selenocysteine lyase
MVLTSMTADGELNIEDIKQTINDKTKIVAIAHISNVLGTILLTVAKEQYWHDVPFQ